MSPLTSWKNTRHYRGYTCPGGLKLPRSLIRCALFVMTLTPAFEQVRVAAESRYAQRVVIPLATSCPSHPFASVRVRSWEYTRWSNANIREYLTEFSLALYMRCAEVARVTRVEAHQSTCLCLVTAHRL